MLASMSPNLRPNGLEHFVGDAAMFVGIVECWWFILRSEGRREGTGVGFADVAEPEMICFAFTPP